MKRKPLPYGYEEKYHSEKLKERIAGEDLWYMIPAVRGDISSVSGKKRMRENDPLFSFIDRYFPDDDYAFEPNMEDGRFVFLPADVNHQGIGIAASKFGPQYLDVIQFWYPVEYMSGKSAFPVDQVAVNAYSVRPDQAFADEIRKCYMQKRKKEHYCTFPYLPGLMVTLKGNFLDDPEKSAGIIRDSLKDQSAQTIRNGEGLILFMYRVTGKVKTYE